MTHCFSLPNLLSISPLGTNYKQHVTRAIIPAAVYAAAGAGAGRSSLAPAPATPSAVPPAGSGNWGTSGFTPPSSLSCRCHAPTAAGGVTFSSIRRCRCRCRWWGLSPPFWVRHEPRPPASFPSDMITKRHGQVVWAWCCTTLCTTLCRNTLCAALSERLFRLPFRLRFGYKSGQLLDL